MPEFVEEFRVRWPDMDFLQHMRNAAYLGCAEDTRMRFLDASGWPMSEFARLQLAPIVVEDKVTYRHELRLLEAFRVDFRLAALSADGRKLRFRNTFTRAADGLHCATVESLVLWFDIATRKPVAPPPALHAAMSALAKTDDFEALA